MHTCLRTRLALASVLLALPGTALITLGLSRAAVHHLHGATGTHLQELATASGVAQK
ncbi:hypothetical protein [Deinococcus malanensis]|uniref:hypothetical protein n=1 Tax=Deinococcus malanensis TaxID=1706855 RepID=UPI001E302313|nr:hypothetical protein [Deinococcus malanensis]